MGDVPVVRRFVQCLVVVGAQVRLDVEDDLLHGSGERERRLALGGRSARHRLA
jgi:hypothetical protein